MRVRLSDIAEIHQGQNKSRIKNKHGSTPRLYNSSNFEVDSSLLTNIYLETDYKRDYLREGDIIINASSFQSGVVHRSSDGLIFDNNYIRVILNKKEIYPLYFIFIINESDVIKRQLDSLSQGTTVKKLTVTSLNKIFIELPDYETQEKVGEIYRLSKLITSNINKRNKLFRKYIKGSIEKTLKEEFNERNKQ